MVGSGFINIYPDQTVPAHLQNLVSVYATNRDMNVSTMVRNDCASDARLGDGVFRRRSDVGIVQPAPLRLQELHEDRVARRRANLELSSQPYGKFAAV
jgi:hypothetical protein